MHLVVFQEDIVSDETTTGVETLLFMLALVHDFCGCVFSKWKRRSADTPPEAAVFVVNPLLLCPVGHNSSGTFLNNDE